MKLNSTAMSESFYLSNMSPQLAGFNRGIWKNLEALTRNWAVANSSEFDVIVTGPILKNENCGVVGVGVTVPCQYYRIYADLESGKSIGFILPNQSSSSPINSYAVSINTIEGMTGIDFFPQLEDEKEDLLESQLDINNWNWSVTSTYTTSNTNTGTVTTATQCLGIAKSTGVRCRSKTLNSIGYCHYHVSQAGTTKVIENSPTSTSQCTATTQAGNRCKRMASGGSSTCWQH